MHTFTVRAKHWPDGALLDVGAGSDTTTITAATICDRFAPQFVLSEDGFQTYRFLFWNTGRRLTPKRHVIWNFSALNWTTWNATRWYGTPPGVGNGGPPRVHAEAFTVGGDQPMADSPIDGAASTFAPGAWPLGGNNHEVGTAGGPAHILPIDPYSSYSFAGWLRLLWGGDASGDFTETDVVSGGGGPGSPGFFASISGTAFDAATNSSADVIASYGYHSSGRPLWLELVEDVLLADPRKWIDPSDPAPEDLLRIRLLREVLAQTRPARGGGLDLQTLIKAAPTMTPDQLRRAVQSVHTTLDLARSALQVLEARLGQRSG